MIPSQTVIDDLLGDAPLHLMFPPIFLRHLYTSLLIVANSRRSTLTADRVHSQLRYLWVWWSRDNSNLLQSRDVPIFCIFITVTISSYTRTISFSFLLSQISWTTCHERMFIYFYFPPCITRMLHASDTCLSFLMLRILFSLLYHTCSTCFKHALYACFTLYIL